MFYSSSGGEVSYESLSSFREDSAVIPTEDDWRLRFSHIRRRQINDLDKNFLETMIMSSNTCTIWICRPITLTRYADQFPEVLVTVASESTQPDPDFDFDEMAECSLINGDPMMARNAIDIRPFVFVDESYKFNFNVCHK